MEQHNSYGGSDFDHLVTSAIPHELWTVRGIDWVSNSVMAQGNFYCDVSMSVEALLALFPGERTPGGEVEFVGDFVRVKELSAENVSKHPRRTLGRPPAFAWDAFHVEVADLIKSGRLSQKKEAAIQLMINWFETTQKQKPSRSAVSEKLTPYYRRFFSPGGGA